jgi:hypothetical protein
LGIICERYDVTVVMNEIPFELPREQDKWLMQEFVCLGYPKKDLEWLNQVRLFQQVLFLSDILGASGSTLDERYLCRHKQDEVWSTIKFPRERHPSADFRLWQQALRSLVPAAGLPVCLGKFLHKGYKIWEWRVCYQEQYLLHYTGDMMEVYTPTSTTLRRWSKESEGCDPEILGVPCSVRESTHSSVEITSTAAPPYSTDLPGCFLDVLREWGHTWMWDLLWLIGDDNWLLDTIREGTCIAVTDGLHICELYPNMCSCAFVLECTQGRGWIFGSFLEQST